MKLIRNSIFVSAPVVVGVLVSIITVPIYVATIGSDRFGALLIGLVLLGYFGQADFGLGMALTQRISSRRQATPREIANIIWSGLAGGAAVAAAGAALIYVASTVFFEFFFEAAAPIRAEGVASAWLLALCIPIVILTAIASGSLAGGQRFGVISAAGIISSVLSQVLPLVIAHVWSAQLPWLIAGALLGRGAGLAVMVFKMWQLFLRRMPVAPSIAELRGLLVFGSWVMVTAIVGPLMVTSDRIVIGAVIGSAAVVAYSIPFQIGSRTVLLPNAVAQALFPRLAAQSETQPIPLAKLSAIVVGQWYALPVVGLVCLADPLLHLWLGDRIDTRSILIGQILMVGFWVNAIAYMPYSHIQAGGNSRFTGTLHLIELPIYFAMLFLFGWIFGLYGVALAFAARNALDCVALLIKAGFWDRDLLVRLAGPSIVIVASLCVSVVIDGWFSGIVAAGVLCLLLLGFCWLQMPHEAKARLPARFRRMDQPAEPSG